MRTGRPPLYDERMQLHTIGLPPSMMREIKAYGDDNLGRGVRKLWLEHTKRVKIEQTKEWERDWRSNPTAPTDPLHVIICEPGQEMLPPPDDPTTEETALSDPREDSGAIEAAAVSAFNRTYDENAQRRGQYDEAPSIPSTQCKDCGLNHGACMC